MFSTSWCSHLDKGMLSDLLAVEGDLTGQGFLPSPGRFCFALAPEPGGEIPLDNSSPSHYTLPIYPFPTERQIEMCESPGCTEERIGFIGSANPADPWKMDVCHEHMTFVILTLELIDALPETRIEGVGR